jgi:hypothetical protein
LCIGITLAILNLHGTIPAENEKLNIISNGLDNDVLKSFNIFTGILKGPIDLFEFSAAISFSISVEVTGDKKNFLHLDT